MSKLILFYGDSITDAGRDRNVNDGALGVGYPTLIKAELGYNKPGEYVFYNKGTSGDRVVDLYARMKMDLINHKPDYVSILIGVNDVWHEVSFQNGVDVDKYEMVYGLLVSEIMQKLPQTKIMIMEPFVLEGCSTQSTPECPNRWHDFSTEVPLRAAAAKRIAEKYNLPFIELQKHFDAAAKLCDGSYWLADGVHPTAMGHEIIKREWLKTFEQLSR